GTRSDKKRLTTDKQEGQMIDTHPTTDTLILVVHEIYGQNSHMMHVCQQLTAAGYAVLCPNLLERESPYEYAEEAEAYRSFMENVGFLRAAEKIKSVLREQKGRVTLVCFSSDTAPARR